MIWGYSWSGLGSTMLYAHKMMEINVMTWHKLIDMMHHWLDAIIITAKGGPVTVYSYFFGQAVYFLLFCSCIEPLQGP